MKNICYTSAKTIEYRKLRVAAYCRVRTSGLVQSGSLEIQIETFMHIIESCPDWIFVSGYYDIGSRLRRTVRTGLGLHIKKGFLEIHWNY